MRGQSWGQQEIRSSSKPFRRKVLHFNLSTFPFKMALTQKTQHFPFLGGRKDGRRNKKKGVYKGKTSNGIKLRCRVLFPGGFFRQVKLTHIKRNNSERNWMTSWCPSHLQLGQARVMTWLLDYMTGPKRPYLKHTFWSYSSIEDWSPFFITHQTFLICFMHQIEVCLLVIIQNTNRNPLVDQLLAFGVLWESQGLKQG